jgi:hypothetical protein
MLQEGQAYRNISGQLYKVTDRKNPNYSIFSNPYGQFVYDSSVSGANVPSGAYINGNFNARGSNGLIVDYNNGRCLFTGNVNQNVTASYAVKDFNLYYTTQTDAQLVFANKQELRPKFNVQVTGVPSSAHIAPLIYIKRDFSASEPFALGGQDLTTAQYRAIVMSNDDFALDGIGSIFTDAVRKNIMLLTGTPLNRYGDVVNGQNYNYLNAVSSQYDPNNLIWIDKVDYYRFNAETEVKVNKDVVFGFLDFTIKIPRFPRQ